jgi:transposase IS66 family protein
LRHVPPPFALCDLSRPELEALLVELFGKVADLEKIVGEQREEIARLKGLKGRPDIKPSKPSGMDNATEPPKPGKKGLRRFRGKVAPRVKVEDRLVQAAVPEGSRFKGYEPFLVQDLVISATATRYQRERWVTPDGQTILAPLPEGIDGHFGPELRRFVLMQYYQGQSTLPRLATFLRSVGIAISKRQLQRLLTDKQESFFAEARDVLRAGLETSPYVSVDDTGARHVGKNGYCTQIGNDWFTWFGTRSSKSRLNFLELLRAGYTDYVLNDAAYGYMRKHSLSAPLIASLAAQPQIAFADQDTWLAHLDRLGFTTLDVTPDPVRVATEGALWGSVQSHKLLCDAVVLSDDAGRDLPKVPSGFAGWNGKAREFNVGQHALCWVHAERLVHKLDTFTDKHRAAQTRVRGLIWDYYADLKAYRLKPSPRRAVALRARFDRLFLRRTGFVTLDRLLKRLHANKAELLMVLDRPETPLHTNGSENDIRCYVTRRKLSAGTRSDVGRDCRDAFLGLAKTCDKLGIAAWDYLGSRLKVAGHIVIQPLDRYVRARFRPA